MQRPIVAIVRKVDASIAKIARVDSKEAGASQSNSTNSVPVIVVGRFLKRLAYQSSIGADLAPVLVGQVFELKPVRSPQPMQPAVDDDSVAGTIAMAVLVGLAIAIVVFWRSRANVMRSRRLRYAHRDPPRPFLQAMAKGEFEAREKLPPDGEHSSI